MRAPISHVICQFVLVPGKISHTSTAIMADVKEHSEPPRSAEVSIPINYEHMSVAASISKFRPKSTYAIVEQSLDDCWVHYFLFVHFPYLWPNHILSKSPHGLPKHILFLCKVPERERSIDRWACDFLDIKPDWGGGKRTETEGGRGWSEKTRVVTEYTGKHVG